MKKKTMKVLVAGDDLRQVYCAEKLASYFDVYYTCLGVAVPKKAKPANVDMKEQFDAVVLPVPAGRKMVCLAEIKALLKPGGIVLCGVVDKSVTSIFGDFKIVDYMKAEDLTILNAIPSAEGAVQIALAELPTTINRQKILVAGYGRIGRALCGILKGFGADLTVEVHSRESNAWATLAGLNSRYCNSGGDDGEFGLIINTVPALVFPGERLARIRKDALIIDLASLPGGVDFESAKQLEIKTIHALGLPGKVAPATAGEIIAETVVHILKEVNICSMD